MSASQQQALPESYRRLNEFAVRFAAASTIYEHDVVPDRFFLVLSGRVRLEAFDDQGVPSPAGEAGRGQLIGHLAAFDARPAMTAATAIDDAVLIAVPMAQAAEAFALSPELAIEVARDLARRATEEVDSEIPEQLAAPAPAASKPDEAEAVGSEPQIEEADAVRASDDRSSVPGDADPVGPDSAGEESDSPVPARPA